MAHRHMALAESSVRGSFTSMSFDFAYQFRQEAPRAGFKDLDNVMLTAAATTDDGDVMPEGSEGTVVGVWRDGEAYMVEFAEPVGALVTVGPQSIRAVEIGAR